MTEPIAAGREADVFALDDRRVLRRYRADRPGARRMPIRAAGADRERTVLIEL